MTDTTGTTVVSDRLWSLLLESFANGVTVEGYWLFTHDDALFTDFAVSIARTDRGRSGGVHYEDERSNSFSDTLHDLLATAYGEGHDVDGQWTIRYASPAIPDWNVAIDLDPLETADTAIPVEFTNESG